jgi:alpha-L-fucosidase
MGWPGKEAAIPALAVGGKNSVPRIRNIELMGHKEKLKWTQDEGNLRVELPEEKPSDHAVTLKIAFA